MTQSHRFLYVLVVSAAVLVVGPKSSGLTLIQNVDSPENCPKGLVIEVETRDGWVEFNVVIDPEAITHVGELYKDRVGSGAVLRLATSEEEMASVPVAGVEERGKTHYRFSVARSLADTSELQLRVYLFEEDGMVTIGGGFSLQVRLTGFVPEPPEVEETQP